jgi:formylglycine-generating enzyme required for sulfatase activity
MAIEDLIETYGSRYPKGSEFLKRLEDPQVTKSLSSTEFLALKREALLLANPAVDFDKLLLVKAHSGRRYTANWQTRTSAEAQFGKISSRDLDKALQDVANKDQALKDLYGLMKKAEKSSSEARKKMERSQPYKSEKDKTKSEAMIESLAEVREHNRLKEQLHTAAMKSSKYAEVYSLYKEEKEISNYDDELLTYDIRTGKIESVYRPKPGKFIGDTELHFDADRIMFTSFRDMDKMKQVDGRGRGYAVVEIGIDPVTGKMRKGPRIVSPDMGSDVDCYDACYLPDDKIIFSSTAAYEGVPCVGGGDHVANLYRMNSDGSGVRRLTFDQDGNWHPAMMENGRVLYLRWEYTDSAHYFSRVLMSMNPDGTDQKAYYGSNSYWPNGMFYARQVPGKSSMFVASITGHHSNAKGGPICLFDVSKGRFEADGAIQFFTGRDKVVHPVVLDGLSGAYNTMYYTPYPLNDKFCLTTYANGTVFLVDVFDNIVRVMENHEGKPTLEPLPLRKTKKPFVKPDVVRLGEKTATVLINDVYAGPGIAGVPRGTVKNLRVYRYEYGPRNLGGHYAMGVETCWDAKQILGTATVEEDGSANFMVPANMPIAFQPLDAEGRALAIMRSWTVAMPGETLACVGCHESQNMPPPAHRTKAMVRKPEQLRPFYGPARGYSFKREIMPIIDRNCVGCHNKNTGKETLAKLGIKPAARVIGTGPNAGKKFSEAGIPSFHSAKDTHDMIHPYVRRNGPEGDYHVLTALEFHADTSELVQMLKKGHYNVKLKDEDWRKIYTWIDLNAPLHGTWTEARANPKILERRMELRQLYANVDYNPEEIVNPYTNKAVFVPPVPLKQTADKKRQAAVVKGYKPEKADLDLGDGVKMNLVRIPAGEFSIGSNGETPMERPVSKVKIKKPFMMGSTEVTLRQYRKFDPDYLNGVYDMHWKDQVSRGYYMNDMDFPVIRVPWLKALEYCEWLSKKTGKKVTLPTEAEWEWACRAGTDSSLSYGGLDTDFSKHANLADAKVIEMAVSGVDPKPRKNPSWNLDYELKDNRFRDDVLHLAEVGKFAPNAWGLHDMHGNAAEWTMSEYVPYPYSDKANSDKASGKKRVVRGGSWHDRPFRSTSTYRLGYPKWQKVYHTGFRVVVAD